MEQFIVSARKYRPTTFASVVGQKHITSTLKNAIERNQLAHAYLFCGPRGVGKTTCARIFAKAINCLNPNGAEACNECDSCRSFNEGRSLNIHELDAASNNSVDDIRNIIDQVRVVPQLGHFSVFIIDEVHMLSSAAFNAFLKTLEEPPQHAIFILATTEKHKIIPTILSRCQIYDFNRIRVEDAVEYLRYIASNEGVTADEESLNLIAQKADGGMRDALSMFDKAVSFCGSSLEYRTVAQTLNLLDYDTYFRFTDLLLQGDYVNALLEFDRVLAKGFSGRTFLGGLNQHMRDLIVAKGPAISLIEYTAALMERYRSQAEKCDVGFLFGAISLLTDADGHLRTASNQRLLVELTLMKIAAIGQKKNSGLNLPVEQSYPLPSLDAQPQTAVNQAQAQPQTPPQQSVAQPQTAHVQSVATQSAPSANAAPAASPAPRPTPAAAPTPTPAPTPAEPQVVTRQRVSSFIPGGSLTSLLNRVNGVTDGDAPGEHRVDPRSEEKLTASREEIIRQMAISRPRFNSAFDTMRFEGNKIHVVASAATLESDLRQSKSEILEQIVEIAQIDGVLELEIELKEIVVHLRPVKLEDRVHHIEKVMPNFNQLCEALDLEAD